jgi:hypothetical protein
MMRSNQRLFVHLVSPRWMPFSDEMCALEEDVMSLSLLTTTVLQRLGITARKSLEPSRPPQTPKPDTPHERRERLRQQVVAGGGTLAQIETIRGDCRVQTAQQIADLSGWLARRNASCPESQVD